MPFSLLLCRCRATVTAAAHRMQNYSLYHGRVPKTSARRPQGRRADGKRRSAPPHIAGVRLRPTYNVFASTEPSIVYWPKDDLRTGLWLIFVPGAAAALSLRRDDDFLLAVFIFHHQARHLWIAVPRHKRWSSCCPAGHPMVHVDRAHTTLGGRNIWMRTPNAAVRLRSGDTDK